MTGRLPSLDTYFPPRELPLVESNQASLCASRQPGDRKTSGVGEQETGGPGDRRTRIPGNQRTTGPEDQETGGLQDQSKGPKDQGTSLPEDPQTGEQQKRPIKEYVVLIRLYFYFDPLFIFLMLVLLFFDTYAVQLPDNTFWTPELGIAPLWERDDSHLLTPALDQELAWSFDYQ